MNKFALIVIFILASCSSSDKEYAAQEVSSFKSVNYITLTNESTNGGSQIGYLKSGLVEGDVAFCFCDVTCSREIITVFELQYNEDSNDFRFKDKPSDAYTIQTSNNWCTKVN